MKFPTGDDGRSGSGDVNFGNSRFRSSATTLDLRSSVCIRLMDTFLTLSHSLPKHRLGVAENTMVRSRANPLAQAPASCLGLVSHLFQRKARDSSVRQLPPLEAGEDGAPCQSGTLPVLLRILEIPRFLLHFEPFVCIARPGIPLTQCDGGSGTVAPLCRACVALLFVICDDRVFCGQRLHRHVSAFPLFAILRSRRDVDKVVGPAHLLGHPVREVRQLFRDVLLEDLFAPAPHFLDLVVAESSQA